MPEVFRKILGIAFFSFCFGYGVYIAIAAMRNYKPFIDSYKRIDLIKIFGDFGRVLYVIFGAVFSVLSLLMILRFLGFGPFVGAK
jgi:hypothetical protein